MDDVISRQAAIDALGEEPEVWLDTDVEIAQRAQWRTDKAAIEAVPTAGCEYWDTESNYCALYRPAAVPTAEKTGKWMKTVTLYPYCSECDWMPEEDEMTHGFYRYCPNCGAKMMEESDG